MKAIKPVLKKEGDRFIIEFTSVIKHDSCVIQLYGKDGQPVGRQEHSLSSPKVVSNKNEYTLEVSLDPRLTFKGGETMYISLSEPGGAGDTYGPPTVVDISCLLGEKNHLKKLWNKIKPYSKWLKWISIILIIVSCLVSICYGLYKWRKDVASRTPITEPADRSSVARSPILERAPAPTSAPVRTPAAAPQTPAASVPTGDDRTVIINHGHIEKIEINHNYGGHGSSQGARGQQAKPWPYGAAPNKVVTLLEGDCSLPPGSKIQVKAVVPRGEDHWFKKPPGWTITPLVYNRPEEVRGAYNLDPTNPHPMWKDWQSPERMDSREADLRFWACGNKDVVIVFTLEN